MDETYGKAEQAVSDAVGVYAAGKHTDRDAPPTVLSVKTVTLTGAPRSLPSTGGFVSRLAEDPLTGDKRERLDMNIAFNLNASGAQLGETDLRAADQGQVEAGVLAALKDLFSKIALTDKADGPTLADKYDWTNQIPEAKKPYKEQLADLKAQIDTGIEQAQGAIPAEVVALLQHAKIFDAESGTVFGYDSNKPSVYDGRVIVNFSVPNKDEGEKSNASLAQENILARKDAILDSIRNTVRTQHPGIVSDEELAKLDLQVSSSETGYDGNVNVSIGSKLATVPNPNEPTVGPNALSTLSEDILNRIVKDSILLQGQGAGDVAHLIAGDSDVRHFLELYQDKAPGFAEALKSSDILKQTLSWKEREELEKKREETTLIVPSVTVDTSISITDGKLNNSLYLGLDLPKGITHTQVVRALAGKPLVVGPATQAIVEKGATAEEAAKSSGVAA